MIKKILKIICKILPFLEPYLFKFIRKNAKRSKGEKLIYEWLKENNISFKQEYLVKFPYIIKKKPYVFIDFYLPKHNIFIEYNGRQHYEYTPYFHKSEVDFELQKFRDVTVRNYCKNKGITLIEIPYTMTNEEVCDLLKKEIIND
jgi:very-short-patch-repair endonuclease